MEHGDYQRFLYSLEHYGKTSWSTVLISVVSPRAQFRWLAREFEKLSVRLASVDPPVDAVDEHHALIDSFRRSATELRRIARDRTLSRSDLCNRLVELPSFDAAISAGEQLRARGYIVPTGATRPTP